MKKISIIFNNLYMLHFLFRMEPAMVLGIIITSILNIMTEVVCGVILLRYMVNSILGDKNMHGIFCAVLATAFFLVFTVLLSAFFQEFYLPDAKERISKSIQKRLGEKAVNIDVACYDNPEYYDEMVWNMTTVEEKIEDYFANLGKMPGYIASLLTTIVVFSIIDLKIFLFVMISVFFTVVFNRPLAKCRLKKENDGEIFKRKKLYINRIFKKSDYMQELKTGNLDQKMMHEYEKNQKDTEGFLRNYNRELWLLNFLQVYLSGYFVADFLVIIYLGYHIIVTKTMEGGDLVAVFNGVNTLLNALYYLFGNCAKQFMESAYFIEKFRKFLTMQTTMESGKRKAPDSILSIELRNVSFGYGKHPEILHGINLEISRGEKIALVGLNGEGKTTLVKLIMRLYDPTHGEILLNGINIKEYDLKEYLKMMGCVFQDFQIYAASVGCNISGGSEIEQEKAGQAIKQCGLEKWISRMEHGLETELFQEFNERGTELSKGEKQKIALARALYRNPELLILDEPSSALDPFAERQLNNTIMKLSDDITAIFISHRLAVAVNADCIYVLAGGIISESGSHNDLVQEKGLYAKMWECQAGRYAKMPEQP